MHGKICFVLFFVIFISKSYCEMYIDNFQKHGNLSSWTEHSDTIMAEGKSKSSFVLQDTSIFRRAVLFTLLNPQPCGAAFAGIMKKVYLDISKYKMISLKIKGQGQYTGYEFFLRHKGQTGGNVPTYVHYFYAPDNFDVIQLPIEYFRPYLRGVLLKDGEPLDKTEITALGILAYGGAHLPKKQHGAAALEIDWIKFV